MRFIRKLFYLLPPTLRFMTRRIFFLPMDLIIPLETENGIKLPARGLIYTGSGDFLETGKRFTEYFGKYAGLTSSSHLLDIGCGIGRMAIPLTNHISNKGRYEGFDAIEKGVQWCRRNIQEKFNHFHFQYIPLSNDLYRKGGMDPTSFIFPYPSRSFDLCIAISVFTHMLPDELNNYFKEINRVLKAGGKCFATFFVLDEQSSKAMKFGSFQFLYNMGDHFLFDKHVKAANVALPKQKLEHLFVDNKLEISGFYRGRWSGIQSNESLDFQDIYILTKNHNGD